MQKLTVAVSILAALALVSGVYKFHSTHKTAQAETSAFSISGPVKAIYIDYKGINWASPGDTVKQAVDAGYNLVILAFYLNAGPADMAVAWQGLSADDRTNTINYAHSKGAAVTVSAGGSTDSPYTAISGSDYGNKVAQWAVSMGLDGVDFDMENFGPSLTASGLSADDTIQWLADATNTARNVLGGDAIITHAPQAPYFGQIGGGANSWTGTTGGYTAVYQKASSITYLLVQFYNQGSDCYVDYRGIFESSCSNFPGTSVNEIAQYGIPLNKIVVGKPVAGNDASNGWVNAGSLGSYAMDANSKLGWNAGYMGWVWDSPATGDWIHNIYPSSFLE